MPLPRQTVSRWHRQDPRTNCPCWDWYHSPHQSHDGVATMATTSGVVDSKGGRYQGDEKLENQGPGVMCCLHLSAVFSRSRTSWLLYLGGNDRLGSTTTRSSSSCLGLV